MRLLTKLSLVLAAFVFSVAAAPAAKADVITVTSGGFSLANLGHAPDGIPGMDALIGFIQTTSNNSSGGSFVADLNPLMFANAFTGLGTEGTYNFSFDQLLTINGVTHDLNLQGVLNIGTFTDTIDILGSAPLTFNLGTFSVDVTVLPTELGGFAGVHSGVLQAQFDVRNHCNPVPEPATLTLLGLGVAGVAMKLRRRKKLLG